MYAPKICVEILQDDPANHIVNERRTGVRWINKTKADIKLIVNNY